MTTTTDTVAKLVNPAVESHDLMSDLPAVWQEQLSDPKVAAEIASLLRLDTAQLKSLAGAPVDIQQDESGVAGSDIIVIVATWVATDVLLKALAELGKNAVKQAIRNVWERYLKPSLEKRQRKPGALGDRVEMDS